MAIRDDGTENLFYADQLEAPAPITELVAPTQHQHYWRGLSQYSLPSTTNYKASAAHLLRLGVTNTRRLGRYSAAWPLRTALRSPTASV